MSKIRKLYQSIFLIFSFYVFTADTALGESAVRFFHSLHIFPSLNAAFSGHGSRWMAVTLMLLVLTVFFGRFYCSFLCPVGFLQDILSSLAKRIKIKPSRVTNYPRLRVFMLFFTVFLALFNTGLWGWLDHFSIFGRLTNGFAIPAVNFILSPLEPYLNKTNYFQIEGSSAQAGFDFYYSILFIAALLAASAFRPRWFCNTLCPSGALFALIFKSGFMKIKLSPPCPGCKKCERNCPSGSITDGRVDYATCVTCLECVKICPKDILKISFARTEACDEIFPESKGTAASGTRRAFITNMATVAAGIVSAGYSSKLALAFDNVRKIACVIPPGAGTAYNFFSKCSACHMCISNCPSKVLKPALLENGFVGLSKPRMDFEKSYCGFECNICTGVCPSGALTYLPLAKKQTTAVGKVVLDTSAKTECIPYKNKTDCGSCAEHCPTGAVYMVQQGEVFVPKIRRVFCNGCGACEHVCPVAGAGKPIRVVPFPRHIPVLRLADIQDKIKKAPNVKAPNAPAKGVEDAKPSGGTDGFPF